MYDHLNHVQQQFKQREIKIELQGFKSVYTCLLYTSDAADE